MGKLKSDRSSELKRCVVTTVFTVALWMWINLFHDAGSSFFYFMIDSNVDGHPFGVYLSCIATPLGLAVGSLVAFVLAKKEIPVERGTAFFLLVGCLVLHLLYYLSVIFVGSYVPASIAAFFGAALGVLFLFRVALKVLPFKKRDIVPIVLGFVVAHKAITPFVVGVLSFEPLQYVGLFHLCFLIVFCGIFVLARKYLPQDSDDSDSLFRGRGSEELCDRSNQAGNEDSSVVQGVSVSHRPPWPLFVHLVCYGLGFGIVHGMLGFFDDSVFVYTESGLLEIPVTIILAILCARNITKPEIMWQRIRGVVFPMVIVGYSLITITLSPDIPSFVVECASGVYSILFIIGCCMMARETTYSFTLIISLGFFFKYLGFSLGVLFGYIFGSSQAFASQTTATLVFIAVFIAFSAGTFWIGSEQSMRKWWGLRQEKTPEYQHRETLQEKCAELAKEYKLSARESEILVLLASGKRASQIKEEYFLSIYTVRGHIQGVYRKLGVHSAQELDSFLANAKIIVS